MAMGVCQASGVLGKGMNQLPWMKDPHWGRKKGPFPLPQGLPDSVALQTGVGPLSGDRLQRNGALVPGWAPPDPATPLHEGCQYFFC